MPSKYIQGSLHYSPVKKLSKGQNLINAKNQVVHVNKSSGHKTECYNYATQTIEYYTPQELKKVVMHTVCTDLCNLPLVVDVNITTFNISDILNNIESGNFVGGFLNIVDLLIPAARKLPSNYGKGYRLFVRLCSKNDNKQNSK